MRQHSLSPRQRYHVVILDLWNMDTKGPLYRSSDQWHWTDLTVPLKRPFTHVGMGFATYRSKRPEGQCQRLWGGVCEQPRPIRKDSIIENMNDVFSVRMMTEHRRDR